jgi:hypothetical protein
MDLNKAINESIDTLWNQRQYPASSEWPRKDFVPFGARNDYNFPYQKGTPPVFPPTAPMPENTPSMPWPLQTVDEDIADSFVYLLSAVKKMQRCVKENPSPTKEQKLRLKQLIKVGLKTLKTIEKIGIHIRPVADLAKPLPPQSPS